jgi:hypothetical protein
VGVGILYHSSPMKIDPFGLILNVLTEASILSTDLLLASNLH